MNVNKLAWRNLWRRKRRTLITAFSIAFGVILAVTFTGTGDYYYTKMIDSGASMGHITVTAIDYNRAPSLKKRLSNISELRSQLNNGSSKTNITDAMARINGQAMFASANKTIGGVFIAIDPAQESTHNNLFIRSIIEGDLFSTANTPGIVIGVNLIGGLDVPSEGVVWVDQINLASLSASKLSKIRKNRIGFVFQAYNLIPVMTAYENAEFVLNLQSVAES